jgi:DNA replication protein DnaC
MSDAQIQELLLELRLPGFREELEHQFKHIEYSEMPISDRILRMLQAESERRYRNKIDRLMKAAKFKYQADPESIDFRNGRNLDKSEVLSLLKCDWIKQKQNLLITGMSGTGKTWLVCALGASAVRQELSVRYSRAGRLVEEMMYARLEGYAQGQSKAAIARRLHVSDVSVRKWLHGTNASRQQKVSHNG